MPTDDLPVETEETELDMDNAEETLAVPPPSFRERLKAAQRARHVPEVFGPAKTGKLRKADDPKKQPQGS